MPHRRNWLGWVTCSMLGQLAAVVLLTAMTFAPGITGPAQAALACPSAT